MCNTHRNAFHKPPYYYYYYYYYCCCCCYVCNGKPRAGADALDVE